MRQKSSKILVYELLNRICSKRSRGEFIMAQSKPIQHPHPPQGEQKKYFTQTISLMVGIILFILCLCGLLFNSFAGLHLSVLNSLIIGVAGGTLFYNGYIRDNELNSFNVCVGFGLFFGILSMVGFTFGTPGTPTIGYGVYDPYLIKIIPGFAEQGQSDHVLSGVIALVLLGGAMDWYRRHQMRPTYSQEFGST